MLCSTYETVFAVVYHTPSRYVRILCLVVSLQLAIYTVRFIGGLINVKRCWVATWLEQSFLSLWSNWKYNFEFDSNTTPKNLVKFLHGYVP